MDFPILDLIDNESASDWLLNHFHPNGLTCPHCEANVIGRETGQVRLRVVHHADKAPLTAHVHQFTELEAIVYTDECPGYSELNRCHATVCHGQRQWARDADTDEIREVHTNTIEGVWTPVRNFLRPFRGVHKKLLAGYVAMCEFCITLKRITGEFISKLVACTYS